MEKEEEDETVPENDGVKDRNKNEIKNKAGEKCFNEEKKILNNVKKLDNEKKKNNIFDKNKKENTIFNHYISNISKRVITLNNNSNFNCFSRNMTSSFNTLSRKKESNHFHIINNNDKKNTRTINIRNRNINMKLNKMDSVPDISLPNLNMSSGKESLRSLSSIRKGGKFCTEVKGKEREKELRESNSFKRNFKSLKYNCHQNLTNGNSNYNNTKINFISTITNSNNILIPLMSASQKNILNPENNNNKTIKIFDGIGKKPEENNKNIIYELINKNNNKFMLNNNKSFMAKFHKIKIEKGIARNMFLEQFNNNNLLNNAHSNIISIENNLLRKRLPAIYKSFEKNPLQKM